MLSQPEPEVAVDRTVVLPAHCTTVTAEDVRVRAVLAADFDGAVAIDASRVESVGQAVLQILVAARRECLSSGHAFRVIDPTPAFIERVNRCCLADDLGLEPQEEYAL